MHKISIRKGGDSHDKMVVGGCVVAAKVFILANHANAIACPVGVYYRVMIYGFHIASFSSYLQVPFT